MTQETWRTKPSGGLSRGPRWDSPSPFNPSHLGLPLPNSPGGPSLLQSRSLSPPLLKVSLTPSCPWEDSGQDSRTEPGCSFIQVLVPCFRAASSHRPTVRVHILNTTDPPQVDVHLSVHLISGLTMETPRHGDTKGLLVLCSP